MGNTLGTRIKIIGAALLAATLLLPLGAPDAIGGDPEAVGSPEVAGVQSTDEATALTASAQPPEGLTGTALQVSGSGCRFDDGGAADGARVDLRAGDSVVALGTVAVDAQGGFAGEVVVPNGTASGAYDVVATCIAPEFPDLGETTAGTFTVTGEGPVVAQTEAPTPPSFAAGIEPYPSYDGQSTCSPSAKPGTIAFRDMVLAEYPNTGTYGISRDCSIGGTSEHKEGRAWDWRANVNNSGERAAVDDFLDWLLATDQYGNKHAMARRLGVMYIIWNRQIFRMYRANEGWSSYSGSSPHTDHVHFSLTRDGGDKKTSYWTAGGGNPPPPPPPPPGPTPKRPTYTQSSKDVGGTFKPPIPGDFNGDGNADILWYGLGGAPDYIWWGTRGRGFSGARINPRGRFEPPLVGDFDGDGRDDILWYGRGNRGDAIWYGRSNKKFASRSVNVKGSYDPPMVGDFDGDGRDDIFWYGPGSNFDYLWFGKGNRTFAGVPVVVSGVYDPPFAGDFNGDGRDDIFWYGRGSRPDFLWQGNANRTFTHSARTQNNVHRPFTGDFDGDGRDDIFWYAPGSAKDRMWFGRANGSFGPGVISNVQGTYNPPFSADFDGNGSDDVFWYRPGNPLDYIWWFD